MFLFLWQQLPCERVMDKARADVRADTSARAYACDESGPEDERKGQLQDRDL